MRYCIAAMAAAGLLFARGPSFAADWITAPSYYTHDPQTGERVTQYAQIGLIYIFPRSDYMQSGYRHTRSSIQAGGSADHLHIVEEWGRPVRPYGEWQFPYRPYSVPYDLWGPQYPPFWGQGGGGAWGGGGGSNPGWRGGMDRSREQSFWPPQPTPSYPGRGGDASWGPSGGPKDSRGGPDGGHGGPDGDHGGPDGSGPAAG